MHEAFGCIMRNFQDVITAHSSEKVVSGVSDLSSLTSLFFFPLFFPSCTRAHAKTPSLLHLRLLSAPCLEPAVRVPLFLHPPRT